jgi:hypothetical protein
MLWGGLTLALNNTNSTFPMGGVDAELRPYVDDFYRTMRAELQVPQSYFDYVHRVRLVPADVTHSVAVNAIGLCWYGQGLLMDFFSTEYPHIQLDSVWWRYASDAERRTVVFHEMAHCTLQLGAIHETGPGHIMSPTVPYHYENKWSYEVTRLAELHRWVTREVVRLPYTPF